MTILLISMGLFVGAACARSAVSRATARTSAGTTIEATTGTTSDTTAAATTTTTTVPPATTFLRSYVDPDGRVVRRDQGGDTVSEGQAYAMLLDVAVGNRAQFAAVWTWSAGHLLQPDGLLAFRWQNGRVVDANSASDADVDTARALILAGSQWSDGGWTEAGIAYAAAIVRAETVVVADRRWLVAGPWARVQPYYVNPSYFDPGAFELLASATHNAQWEAVLASSNAALIADTRKATQLPSDWAVIDNAGAVQPAAPPGGGAIVYGYDAVRTLVRQADGCGPSTGVVVDRALRPLAEKTAAPGNDADTYHTDGAPATPGRDPLVQVAAAAAARAAGDRPAMTRDLDAAAAAVTSPSYFTDAWVALAPFLLGESVLTRCQG